MRSTRVTNKSLRRIRASLSLHKRGEVRTDGLAVQSASTTLEIVWPAREVHPWDRDDPPDQKAARFVQQSLEDAEAAISRLFEALPDIDSISVRVVAKESDKIIMAGTVHRCSMDRTAPSVKMRLLNSGIRMLQGRS
jgi:hypothetical protein